MPRVLELEGADRIEQARDELLEPLRLLADDPEQLAVLLARARARCRVASALKMIATGLRTSWATTAASWPTAARFSRSASTTRARSSSADFVALSAASATTTEPMLRIASASAGSDMYGRSVMWMAVSQSHSEDTQNQTERQAHDERSWIAPAHAERRYRGDHLLGVEHGDDGGGERPGVGVAIRHAHAADVRSVTELCTASPGHEGQGSDDRARDDEHAFEPREGTTVPRGEKREPRAAVHRSGNHARAADPYRHAGAHPPGDDRVRHAVDRRREAGRRGIHEVPARVTPAEIATEHGQRRGRSPPR